MPINVPNLLTWLRILLIPLFVGIFYFEKSWVSTPNQNLVATVLFTIAALTDWLDGWLAAGRGNVHVVGMHIPPLDPSGIRNGAFASRGEASKLLAKLAAGGVDLTLYGHVHSYYAFENAGIPAYVSGGGGSIPERFDGMGRHYLVVDVDPGAGRVLSVGVVRID